MNREAKVDNPFETPSATSVDRTDSVPQKVAIDASTRKFMDAACVLIALLPALLIRFSSAGGISDFVGRFGLPAVGWAFMLTSASVLGIWLLGGYSIPHLSKIMRPILGIVIVGVLLGVLQTVFAAWFPFEARPLPLWRDIIVVPRSVLIITLTLAIPSVAASRRFLR
jgi:hypothetical protein